MDIRKLKSQLIQHEGKRNKLYECSAGKMTIGIGHNIEDLGVSEAVINLMFEEDITGSIDDLAFIFDDFQSLPETVQHVLIDMRFQLGPGRFRGFKKMIAAAKDGDWPEMIRQMKDSAWYQQVPNRANNLIRMIEEVM